METEINNEEFIYTTLSNSDKFDDIQNLIFRIFDHVGQYYDEREALKVRLDIEHFLMLHKNQDWSKKLCKTRIFEKPAYKSEADAFSHIISHPNKK